MFLEDLSIEYSKTKLARCRGCQLKIQYGELRIGEELYVDEDEKMVVLWTHVKCFQLGKKYSDIDPTLIKGYQDITAEDQRQLRILFEAGGMRLKDVDPNKKGKKITKPCGNCGNNERKRQEKEVEQSNEQKEGEEFEEKEQSFLLEHQQREKEYQKNKLKKQRNPEKLKKLSMVLIGYSYQDFEKYLNKINDLRLLTNEDLQQMLELNSQSTLGSRESLLHRCADGILFGGIQKCPTCKKANMDFNFSDGYFKCLGTILGTCGRKHESDVVERVPWITSKQQLQ